MGYGEAAWLELAQAFEQKLYSYSMVPHRLKVRVLFLERVELGTRGYSHGRSAARS